MNIDPTLGPVALELGWTSSPRYLLRRSRIKSHLNKIAPGKLLEVGPGAGALLVELSIKGFSCEAYDSSSDARLIFKNFVKKYQQDIPIHAVSSQNWRTSYDVVCAFEVLEHINDDKRALNEWVSWLKPNGIILLSVPSRMKLWNTRDVWAGHVKRYEKIELIQLLENAGLKIEKFESYGFPLANVLEKVVCGSLSSSVHTSENNPEANRSRNNNRSGIERKTDVKLFPLLNSFPGKLAIQTFAQIQKLFTDTDLGNGYIVSATKC